MLTSMKAGVYRPYYEILQQEALQQLHMSNSTSEPVSKGPKSPFQMQSDQIN